MASELETLDGEVVPQASTGKTLTAKQLQSAALEAAGMSRKDIAEAVGVSTATVRNWRQDTAYTAEIDRLTDLSRSQLQPLVTQLTVALIDGSVKAIAQLVEQLSATNKDGDPLWTTRQEAARLLLSNGVKLADAANPKDQQPVGPTQAIQVNITTEKPPAPPDV